jgi:hypothetical protein
MNLMTKSTAHTDEPAIQESLLLAAVDEMRAYAVDRMRGLPDEVDSVLQQVREIVWRRADSFDSTKGRPTDFVFGVTRNVISKELCRRRFRPEQLDAQMASPRSPDPLSTLVSRFDTHRWMSLVADAVGEHDWEVVVRLAFDQKNTDADAAASRSTRSLRSARERVALIAATVRAALDAADRHQPASQEVARSCIPDVAGLQAVLPYVDVPCEITACALGIHPGTVRSRNATVKHLLQVAIGILQAESA